jgi:hypothetical protein
MKTYGGVDVVLTSTLVTGEWSVSRPCRFTPGIHWIGGWVGLIADMDEMEKWKFLTLPELELRSLVVQVGSRYIDYATIAHSIYPEESS